MAERLRFGVVEFVALIVTGLTEGWATRTRTARRTRPKPHHTTRCTSCGYDLFGTMHADRRACPECGAGVNGSQIRWWKLERDA